MVHHHVILPSKYPFSGDPNSRQLTFPCNAPITINTKQHPKNGWLLGSFQGRKGWLPASYVDYRPPPPRSAPPPPPQATEEVSRTVYQHPIAPLRSPNRQAEMISSYPHMSHLGFATSPTQTRSAEPPAVSSSSHNAPSSSFFDASSTRVAISPRTSPSRSETCPEPAAPYQPEPSAREQAVFRNVTDGDTENSESDFNTDCILGGESPSHVQTRLPLPTLLEEDKDQEREANCSDGNKNGSNTRFRFLRQPGFTDSPRLFGSIVLKNRPSMSKVQPVGGSPSWRNRLSFPHKKNSDSTPEWHSNPQLELDGKVVRIGNN